MNLIFMYERIELKSNDVNNSLTNTYFSVEMNLILYIHLIIIHMNV